MMIEDGELIFGKRWNLWTEKEKQEFCSCLEPEDLRYPLYINWAMQYQDYLPLATRDYLDSLRGEVKPPTAAGRN